MRRASLLAVPALLASLLLPAGCGGPDWEGTPVLVVGVDGMEWSVIEPLLEQGRMPHLAGLIERGVGGSLQTMVPTFSPVVWTTIATGVPPQEHGILNFGVYDAKTRQMGLPYTSNTRAVPAVWNMAGENGRSVSSVAWWVSWPAEPVPGGRVVASYAAQAQGRVLWKANVWKDGLPELTWPADLKPALRPALEAGRPGGPLSGEVVRAFGSVPPEWRFPYEREALFRNAYRSDATHVRIACELIEQDRADLNLVYFGLPDVAGHFFWRYHEPGAFQYAIPVEHVEALRGHVAKSYEVADRWLGELLEAAGPDARVLLISDHGMHAFNTGDPDMVQSGGHEDAPDGVFVLAGPGVEPRGLLPAGKRRVAHVLDITPTLLDWLDLDQPEGARGVPRRELMTAEWRAAHPERDRADYRAGFRAPTPPREPAAGLSEEFHEGILAELGYAESLD